MLTVIVNTLYWLGLGLRLGNIITLVFLNEVATGVCVVAGERQLNRREGIMNWQFD